MQNDVFNVVDQVIVRDWEEMASECGSDSDFDLFPEFANYIFISDMRSHCGQAHTILSVKTDYCGNRYYVIDDPEDGSGQSEYCWESWMLRQADDPMPEPNEICEEEFLGLLKGV